MAGDNHDELFGKGVNQIINLHRLGELPANKERNGVKIPRYQDVQADQAQTISSKFRKNRDQ